MKNKAKLIIPFIILLCLCISLGVFLFFRLQNKGTVHIQAEGISIELKRTKLMQYCLGADGRMHEVKDEEVKDFSKAQKENIFGLVDGDIIVPSSRYQADLMVKSSVDVSFAYWILIELNQEGNAFAEQLLVTIQIEEEEKSFRLSNATSFGSKDEPLRIVQGGQSSSFAVKVYFVDDQMINDDAINQSIYFDLILCAVQIN